MAQLVDDQRNQRAIEPDAEHAARHADRDGRDNESGGEGVIRHSPTLLRPRPIGTGCHRPDTAQAAPSGRSPRPASMTGTAAER
jgi:hypothetical protein